ncbi:MAG: hypothetical protein ACKO8O_17285 [Betaproteobacteria bacterium]
MPPRFASGAAVGKGSVAGLRETGWLVGLGGCAGLGLTASLGGSSGGRTEDSVTISMRIGFGGGGGRVVESAKIAQPITRAWRAMVAASAASTAAPRCDLLDASTDTV